METFKSDKRFRLWEYSVSHSILLLRHHNAESRKVIDVTFEGVEYLQIPERLDSLEIVEASKEENNTYSQHLNFNPPKPPHNKLYVLVTSSARYYVVASFCRVFEHNNSYMFDLKDYWNDKGTVRLVYENINPAAAEWRANDD